MIENQAAHEIDEDDCQYQTGKQNRGAGERNGDDLDRHHAQSRHDHGAERQRRIDAMPARGKGRDKAGQQAGNHYQQMNHARDAIEVAAQHARLHR